MKKGFFKFMTSVAILASVFAFVSCEEDKEEKPTPPPSGDHDFTNTGMPVSVFGVEYYGKTFGNYDLTDIATAWDMRVFDKDTTLADAPITKFLAIILLADPSLKVEERLPVGEYEVTTSGMLGDFAPGKIVASVYAKL